MNDVKDTAEDNVHWKLPWAFDHQGVTYYREYLFYDTKEYRQQKAKSGELSKSKGEGR